MGRLPCRAWHSPRGDVGVTPRLRAQLPGRVGYSPAHFLREPIPVNRLQTVPTLSRKRAMANRNLADDTFDPMSIERCRGLLADEANDLSDNEVDSIGRHAEALARVIVEIFLAQRAGAE
jgi:hypothetical protein